jgi:hypothetical protein
MWGETLRVATKLIKSLPRPAVVVEDSIRALEEARGQVLIVATVSLSLAHDRSRVQ